MALHLSDLGGSDRASEAEKAIVRRIATLIVEPERLEMCFAEAGEATDHQLELYQRTANTLRRLLEAVGLQRRPKDVTPTLDQYLKQRHPIIDHGDGDGEALDGRQSNEGRLTRNDSSKIRDPTAPPPCVLQGARHQGAGST
jgi:hypothetical protein